MRNTVVYVVYTLLLVWMSGAHSADLDRVAAEIEAGRFAAALEGLEGESNSHQARLLRANAMAGMGRSVEAEKLYRDLIKAQPRDPSAYNNLATLYAAEGRLQEASELLEQALKSDARYATVHRNLSRIYVEMSSKAYARALRLSGGQQGVHLLSLNHQESAVRLRPQQLAMADVPAAVKASPSIPAITNNRDTASRLSEPAPREPETRTRASESKAVTPPPVAPASSVEKPLAAPAPAPAPAPAAPSLVVAAPVERIVSPKRAAPVETIAMASPSADQQQKQPDNAESPFDAGGAIAALQRWANRWSAQDVNGYLDSYDRNFRPANGLSRAQWQAQRERRLRKPGTIRVSLSDYEVATTEKGGLLVKALQSYRSDNYSDSSRKGFVLVEGSRGWKIREEYTIEVVE